MAQNSEEIQKLKLVRFSDLVDAGIVTNRPTLRRWIRKQSFPRPILLGPNSIAWRAHEVQEWLQSRPRTGRSE